MPLAKIVQADLDHAVALAPEDPAARVERGRVLATLYRRGIERASSAFVVDRRIAPSAEAVEANDPSLAPLRVAAEADLSSAGEAAGPEAERELTRAYLAFVRRRWDEAIAATGGSSPGGCSATCGHPAARGPGPALPALVVALALVAFLRNRRRGRVARSREA